MLDRLITFCKYDNCFIKNWVMALLIWLFISKEQYSLNYLFQKHILKQQLPLHKLLL